MGAGAASSFPSCRAGYGVSSSRWGPIAYSSIRFLGPALPGWVLAPDRVYCVFSLPR